MCSGENECGCQCPDELRDKPEECTPEQIEKCHGSKKGEHPCVAQENKKK